MTSCAAGYADTHVVVVCFSIDNPVSLENVESRVSLFCPFLPLDPFGVLLLTQPFFMSLSSPRGACQQWLPEIQSHCPGVKIILIALKCDLRSTPNKLKNPPTRRLTYHDGIAVAKNIRASRYLECSAKMNRGVHEAFEEIASVAIASKHLGPSNQRACVVA